MQCEHCHQDHGSELRFCPQTGKLISPERFLAPGTLLDDKYCIGSLLGTGGMSAVFEATHRLLQKKVAIKLLLPEFSHDEEMTARLLREARAASATGHRNVAAVTDIGTTQDGIAFIVMEYLNGRSLDRVIEEEAPLPVTRAAVIMCDILSGLDAVHRKGIVHRDLKPNNIMVTIDDDGNELIKILDFGISKMAQDESSHELTTIGKIMGTPAYMAPEQARGSLEIDQCTDIYSCGAILYTMLTGSPPLSAPNYNALIVRIIEGNIAPPSTITNSIPADIDRIVLQAMSLQPEHRFNSAATFRLALEPFCRLISSTHQESAIVVASSTKTPLVDQSFAEIHDLPPQDDSFDLAPAGTSFSPQPVSKEKVPHDTHLFGPSLEDDTPLELAQPEAKRSNHGYGASTLALAEDVQQCRIQQSGKTLYNESRFRLSNGMKSTLLIIVIVLVGFIGWQYRQTFIGTIEEVRKQDKVEIHLHTSPDNADVYIDGVLTLSRPLILPKTENLFSIRVQAKGYYSQSIEIKPDKSQFVEIKLRPRRRR